MSEQTFELDIDRERIRLDDEWLSVADLMSRIKDKIEAGDFRVSRLSTALEQLESTLAAVRLLQLKVTPELVETYEKMAEHEGVPLTWVLRRALVHYLASDEGSGRLFRARRGASARESTPPAAAPREPAVTGETPAREPAGESKAGGPPPLPLEVAADGGDVV